MIDRSKTKVQEHNLPNNIRNQIKEIEQYLLSIEVIDRSSEHHHLLTTHYAYYKDEKKVLIIIPGKDRFGINLIGFSWSINPFAELDLSIDFDLANGAWEITGFSKLTTMKMKEVLKSSFRHKMDAHHLIKFTKSVIHAYVLKNPEFFSTKEDVLNEAVGYFWQGDFSSLEKAYNKFELMDSQGFNSFMKKWKVNNNSMLDKEKLSSSLKLNIEQLKETLSSIETFSTTNFEGYIRSLEYVWTDQKLLSNREGFLNEIESIREDIKIAHVFFNDFKEQIHSINESLVEGDFTNQEKNVNLINGNKEESVLSDLLVVTGTGKSIKILNKTSVCKTHKLQINKEKLSKLVRAISENSNTYTEYLHFIKVLIEYSNDRGFLSEEKFKVLFIGQYDDVDVLKDFCSRHDIKRLFAKSSLERLFDKLIFILTEKEMIRIVTERDTLKKEIKKVQWNYNVKIYNEVVSL
ncbi:hypothetical protein [Guptibacillus hwajinpoensis]|uniref:hypothetical protein n=1 Tax=Guptibacillus hwajinpoensis TaxID=208199 RepID=UPI003CFF7329